MLGVIAARSPPEIPMRFLPAEAIYIQFPAQTH
jgi:hypothetical protein